MIKSENFLKYLFSWVIRRIVGTQKQVWISHGKRAIGVRTIEVRLYICQESSQFFKIFFLILSMLGKNFADDVLKCFSFFFFFFFTENIGISCKLGDNSHKMSEPTYFLTLSILGKKKLQTTFWNIFLFFFLFFSRESRFCHCMQIVSFVHEMSEPIFS